jgi:hypothetical protein
MIIFIILSNYIPLTSQPVAIGGGRFDFRVSDVRRMRHLPPQSSKPMVKPPTSERGSGNVATDDAGANA